MPLGLQDTLTLLGQDRAATLGLATCASPDELDAPRLDVVGCDEAAVLDGVDLAPDELGDELVEFADVGRVHLQLGNDVHRHLARRRSLEVVAPTRGELELLVDPLAVDRDAALGHVVIFLVVRVRTLRTSLAATSQGSVFQTNLKRMNGYTRFEHFRQCMSTVV